MTRSIGTIHAQASGERCRNPAQPGSRDAARADRARRFQRPPHLHLIEPLPLVPQRPMPNVTHELRNVGQTAAKPRLLRLPTNLEVALAVARAVVRKAQKI